MLGTGHIKPSRLLPSNLSQFNVGGRSNDDAVGGVRGIQESIRDGVVVSNYRWTPQVGRNSEREHFQKRHRDLKIKEKNLIGIQLYHYISKCLFKMTCKIGVMYGSTLLYMSRYNFSLALSLCPSFPSPSLKSRLDFITLSLFSLFLPAFSSPFLLTCPPLCLC